jgi:hypothetical protein
MINKGISVSEDYFRRFAEMEQGAVLGKLSHVFKKIVAQDANNGLLYSGATITKFHRATGEAVTEYGASLVRKLSQYPVEHAPISSSDFELARVAVDEMVTRAKVECFRELSLLDRAMPAGVTAEDFDEPNHAAARAVSDIEGLELSFNSERSFLRWAIGDLRKRLWSVGLLAVGSAVTFAVQHLMKSIGNH